MEVVTLLGQRIEAFRARHPVRSSFAHACLSLLLASSFASQAQAAGLELTAPGARALGRGGALISSAIGSDALRYNPARLSIPVKWSAGLDLQLMIANTCFDREAARTTTDPTVQLPPAPDYPEICNDSSGVVPQLAAQFELAKGLGLGLGILAPPGAASAEWGDGRTGLVEVDGKKIPSPARYSQLTSENLAVFPTIGLGYGNEKYRIGASFGWGVFIIRNVSFSAGLPGEVASLDARSALAGVDRFVPRFTLAGEVEPYKGLVFSSVSTFTQDIQAESALYLSGVAQNTPYSQRIGGVYLNRPMGWETALAARYGKKRWDFELDLIFQGNGRVKDTVVEIPKDAQIEGITGTVDGKQVGAIPDRQVVPTRWTNVLVVRFGGDYQILQDRLTARAGFSYETAGVEQGYQTVDNLLATRTGAHIGASVWVAKWLELSLAYARIFQADVTVAPNEARVKQTPGLQPGNLASVNEYVNAGTYKSGYHSLALSLMFRPQNKGAEEDEDR